METTSAIKGIRYSYQIDYMNAEPTHLKSQVHNLPVVSEPQATPLDLYQKQDNYVPNNDSRVTYAAPMAAVSAAPTAGASNSTTIPTAHFNLNTGGVGSAGVQSTQAPVDINPLLAETHVAEPQQLVRSTQAESNVSHPASAVAAEAGMNGNLGNVLHPTQHFVGLDKISDDIPASDANPSESVKATPKETFNRTERSFIPNQNSFFQSDGLESVKTKDDSNNRVEAPYAPVKLDFAEDTIADSNRVMPSYLIPEPDEIVEADLNSNDTFFNRYLGQQAKSLYGYISGAVSQFSPSSLNLLG